MNKVEAAEALAVAKLYDNRNVTADMAQAWADLFPSDSKEDVVRAIRWHFKTSTEYLKPYHVNMRITEVRKRISSGEFDADRRIRFEEAGNMDEYFEIRKREIEEYKKLRDTENKEKS